MLHDFPINNWNYNYCNLTDATTCHFMKMLFHNKTRIQTNAFHNVISKQWIIRLFPCHKCQQNIKLFSSILSKLFPEKMHVPKKEKTLLLLPSQPKWKLVVFTILNGVEVRFTRRLDWAYRLCRPRAWQEWRRNSKASIFLHHAAASTNSALLVGV